MEENHYTVAEGGTEKRSRGGDGETHSMGVGDTLFTLVSHLLSFPI